MSLTCYEDVRINEFTLHNIRVFKEDWYEDKSYEKNRFKLY